MDFDTLDKQMRRFEQSLDRVMLDGIYLVARLDGHGFTRLTKKEWKLEAPFDVRFRDAMIETTKHLMDCGFRMVYGYTQSDEISLLFHLNDDTFGRKDRKLISILASEASVFFTHAFTVSGMTVCLLPQTNLLVFVSIMALQSFLESKLGLFAETVISINLYIEPNAQ